jgi:hypothetical protein
LSIRRRDQRLAIVQFGASDFRIGVDERLMVDAASPPLNRRT